MPHQKQQVYDHSTSSDEDSKSSCKGKEPAGGRHYTKKGKLKRRPKELKGIIITSINLLSILLQDTRDKNQKKVILMDISHLVNTNLTLNDLIHHLIVTNSE